MAQRETSRSRSAKRTKFGHDKNGSTFGHPGLSVVLHDSAASEAGYARYRPRYGLALFASPFHFSKAFWFQAAGNRAMRIGRLATKVRYSARPAWSSITNAMAKILRLRAVQAKIDESRHSSGFRTILACPWKTIGYSRARACHGSWTNYALRSVINPIGRVRGKINVLATALPPATVV